MIRSFAVALAVATLSLPVAAGNGPSGLREFTLPSGNIGCVFIPDGGTDTYQPPDGLAELQCDRIEPDYIRVILGSKGKAKKYTKVGDASCCGGPVLAYGKTFRAGPFTCLSAKTGLTCTRGGHGFVMSRKTVKTY